MKKEMTVFIIVGLLVVIAGAAAYIAVLHRPNPQLTPETVRVGNAVFNVELATTTVAQARGLSYRASLAPGTGMLFIFSRPGIQNFWMKDMNFPIDMIWIGPAASSTGGAGASAGTEQVLGFAENAAPQPGAPLWNLKIYSSPDGTDRVLEVNAGTVAQNNIKVGDPVRIGE